MKEASLQAQADKRLSRFLSLVLRHQPDKLGLTLDAQGWAQVDELMSALQINNPSLSLDDLKRMVATNSKQRFAFNEEMTKIRANQGHSIPIELGLEQQIPPNVLYHGTAKQNVPSIAAHGLTKQQRHHVHLSTDKQTALTVGQRHGKAVVFEVMAGQMSQAGFKFYVSDNGVWLTDHVPYEYLSQV